MPGDLRDAAPGPAFKALPFTSLYLTEDEFAAEIANRTMHGLMHIGRVPDATGGFRVQMAVLVKPNGLLGTGYMAAITPFRRLIVYPTMLRGIERRFGHAPASRHRRTRSILVRLAPGLPIPRGTWSGPSKPTRTRRRTMSSLALRLGPGQSPIPPTALLERMRCGS